MNRNFLVVACVALALPAYAQTGTQSPPGAQSAASTATKQFVEKVAISDMFEVQSSQLALEKLNNDATKQFARKMVDDHTKTSNELKSMAQKLQGVQLPDRLDAQHQQKLEQLRSAAEAQFHQRYRSQQIEGHQAAVDLFDGYSKNGDNAEMKSWAQKTLPHLREHLQQAQALPQAAPAVGQAPAARPGQDAQAQRPEQERQAQRAGAGQQSSMRAIANPGPNHIMASDLRGTTVYGTNNENIGEINDMVLDRNGRIVAVVVGVGGFLGIGEKNVAVPFEAMEIRAAGRDAADTRGSPKGGTTGTAGDRAGQKSGTMEPERIVLRNMTKQDLEAAPSFRSDGRGDRQR